MIEKIRLSYIGNQAGFTLLEVLSASFIALLVGLGATVALLMIAKTNSESMGSQAMSTHQMEVRNFLKKTKQNGTALCMDQFSTLLSSAALSQMVQAGMQTKNQVVNNSVIALAPKDFTNPANTSGSYGSLKIVKVDMTNFRIVKQLDGYVSAVPVEINASGSVRVPLMYVISAQLNTYFEKPGGKAGDNIKSSVQSNFVIRSLQGALTLMDCGVNSLARSTAFIESCKAFGSDFEFVFDRPAQGRGQCYMPIYDPIAGGLGSSPSGQVMIKPTGYSPFRHFLCDGAFAGKSVNFAFCTGEF